MEEQKPRDPELDRQFCEMVDQYQTSLLRLCYLRLRDRGLAEDAVQETFLKAYRALPGYRGECSLKTWLIRIAVNTCRDEQKSRWWKYVNRSVSPEMLPELSENLPEDMIAVDMAIAALPVKLREAVLLYYYSGMQVAEIAQALGISPSSVSGRLGRAKTKLREALKGAYFDE